ncbi:MAG: hypothetical protein LBC61_03075 [Candidatus Peribacteria bacterium]|nr:hypothetical protein [Candidatus Peribacteria bacterium]
MFAIILAKNITNVFKIHCNKVIVTISQFKICDISCQITHSIAFLSIVFKSPVETATKELFFVAHVAKAFGSVST